MNFLVDTSVWSLAWRRDEPPEAPEVKRLARALETRESVVSTGLILQELLQGFAGPKARDAIVERFSTLPLLAADREDHILAAELRNTCRRRGFQVGTIDALLAQLCIRHDLVMLSTDEDFQRIATMQPLAVWTP